MSAQDRTLDQYQEWMNINAVANLIRSSRELGIFECLREGQKTVEQLSETLSLDQRRLKLLLDAVVAIGIIEQYQEDYALSQAARLLCQYDNDLGDSQWAGLAEFVRGSARKEDDLGRYDHDAATQWIHTAAAMQAAEILDLGGADADENISILDLGCGSGVWSCAMAHRDQSATVTMVDHAGALEAALHTVKSISIDDRVTTIEGDPAEVDLPGDFDLVLLAQRLHVLSPGDSDRQLTRAIAAAKSGGKVVVIDEFRLPSRPNLIESIQAMNLELTTSGGGIRTLEDSKEQMERNGLKEIQFTFLAASRAHLGLAVGVK